MMLTMTIDENNSTFSDIAMLIENGNDVDSDDGDLNPIWNDNDVDNYGIMALIIDLMKMLMINDQNSDCANGKWRWSPSCEQ